MRTFGRLLLLLSAFAVYSPAQTLLVANQRDRTISVVDVPSAKQVAVIQETVPGQWAHELAASPDGRTAYLPIYGSSGVGTPGLDGSKMLVVDIPTRKLVDTIDFGSGVRPHCIVYDPNSKLFYITTELSRSVTIFDPSSRKIVGAIPTGEPQSHMLAISHDGRHGYTANVSPGSVSVLDLGTRKPIAVIPISKNTQRISVSNDDSMAFTADQTTTRLAVIDTAARKIKTWIDLPAVGYGTAATTDGRELLVALPTMDKVGIVDLKALKVVRTIDVCRYPQEILVGTDGFAYVSCPRSSQVAAIDVTHGKVRSLIDVGQGADGLAWANAH
jgi:DNA-binding beta-propeller fold protein YncE